MSATRLQKRLRNALLRMRSRRLPGRFQPDNTRSAADFHTVLEAQTGQLAADVKIGRDNRLLPGVTCHEVGSCKRTA